MVVDVAQAIANAPWIRSSTGKILDRQLATPLVSCKITRCSVYALRLGLMLLLLLYVLTAFYYLTNTGSSLYSKREVARPMSTWKARATPKNARIATNSFDASIGYTSNDAIGTNDIVYRQLLNAGVSEERLEQMRSKLPNWADIEQQYGSKPIIHNLDSCSAYQALVPAQKRVLGAAGMFNTGTNLVTQLLKQNCYIPQRAVLYGTDATKEQLGIRWQVPWGKHTPAHYKYRHAASDKAAMINTEDVLPIVTIRHPYRWIQSMCHHPYTAKWDHYHQCPNVLMKNIITDIETNSNNVSLYNPVTVQYGAGLETYASIPHLWNNWYNEYYQHTMHQQPNFETHGINNRDVSNDNNVHNKRSPYPLLIVRMEDLIFHTEDTITSICHCAGGQLYNHNFSYIVTSAKGDSPGHDTTTDIVNAYIKYGTPIQAGAGFESTDYNSTQTVLDSNLMTLFHYLHPTPK